MRLDLFTEKYEGTRRIHERANTIEQDRLIRAWERARQRELERVVFIHGTCVNGPFEGEPISLAAEGDCSSAWIKVGREVGRYVAHNVHRYDGKVYGQGHTRFWWEAKPAAPRKQKRRVS